MSKWKLILTGLLLAIVLLSGSANAQAFWSYQMNDIGMGVEFAHPFFDRVNDVSILTGTYIATIRIRASDMITPIIEIPASHFALSNGGSNNSSSAIGNIYAGIQIKPNPFYNYAFNLGIRMPVMSDEEFAAGITGIYTNPDRIDAFAPKHLPLLLGFAFENRSESQFYYRTGIDLKFLMPLEDYLDNEVYMNYAIQIGAITDKISMKMGFGGVFIATQDNADFAESTLHYLNFNLDFLLEKTRPGVFLRVPLDEDYSDMISSVLGINVMFSL